MVGTHSVRSRHRVAPLRGVEGFGERSGSGPGFGGEIGIGFRAEEFGREPGPVGPEDACSSQSQRA